MSEENLVFPNILIFKDVISVSLPSRLWPATSSHVLPQQVKDHFWQSHITSRLPRTRIPLPTSYAPCHQMFCVRIVLQKCFLSPLIRCWSLAAQFNLFTLHSPRPKPVQYSYCSHTNPEVMYVNCSPNLLSILLHWYSACLIKWITETNCLVTSSMPITNSHNLLTAGHPHNTPSASTITCDIQTSFEKAWANQHMLITKSFKIHYRITWHCLEHAARGTKLCYYAWTSPNHAHFIAWTVHLEYKGNAMHFSWVPKVLSFIHSICLDLLFI